MQRETLNVDEIARLLGISVASAYQAVKRGEIPSLRIGGRWLIPRCQVERLLHRTPQEGGPLREKDADAA